jgi:hypothetical protein
MRSFSKQDKRKNKPVKRKPIPLDVTVMVLTEAGYRCAVPTCRGILALDIHHMVEVSENGGNAVENLLPLCPSCHALYHRGTIKKESIYAWKALLVSLTKAFDVFVVDQLLFLNKPQTPNLGVSGDGVLQFARLIAAGLATFKLKLKNGPLLLYSVYLTETGKQLVSAWSSGDRTKVEKVLSRPV